MSHGTDDVTAVGDVLILAVSGTIALVHNPTDGPGGDFALVERGGENRGDHVDFERVELLRDPGGWADAAVAREDGSKSGTCVAYFSDFDGGFEEVHFSGQQREVLQVPVISAAELAATGAYEYESGTGTEFAFLVEGMEGERPRVGLRRGGELTAIVEENGRFEFKRRRNARLVFPASKLDFVVGECYCSGDPEAPSVFAWALKLGVVGSSYVRFEVSGGALTYEEGVVTRFVSREHLLSEVGHEQRP